MSEVSAVATERGRIDRARFGLLELSVAQWRLYQHIYQHYHLEFYPKDIGEVYDGIDNSTLLT